MPKFKVTKKWCTKIEFGIIEAENEKLAEFEAEKRIRASTYGLTEMLDGFPYYKIERIRKNK